MSCHTLWGYIYLLNLKPEYSSFRVTIQPEDSTLKDVIYLEDKQFPFDDKMRSVFEREKAEVLDIDSKFKIYKFDK